MRLRSLLSFLALSFTFLATMSAEKPFDFNSTPGKLPKHVVPMDYAIRITPDFKKFTFTGSETIKLDVRKPIREIVLNALEIEVASAAVDDKAGPAKPDQTGCDRANSHDLLARRVAARRPHLVARFLGQD